jgi:hypothetical protein
MNDGPVPYIKVPRSLFGKSKVSGVLAVGSPVTFEILSSRRAPEFPISITPPRFEVDAK